MRPQNNAIRKAVIKKRKVTCEAGGPSQRPRTQPAAPTTQAARAAAPAVQALEAPRAVMPVDLTADTPPEGLTTAAEPTSIPSGRADPSGERGDSGPRSEQPPTGEHAAGHAAEETSSPPSGAMAAQAPARADDESVAIPSRPSLMNQGRRAERLVAQICLPEFQGELHRQGASAFFRDAFVAQLWAANSMTAMRDVLRQSDTALRHTRLELGRAQTRAEAAEAALEALHIDKNELVEARRLLEAALAEQGEKVAEIEALRCQVLSEQEGARAARDMLESTRAAVRAQDVRIDSLRLETQSAELRAASAEERARLAGDKAAEREAAARVAEQRVSAAEKKASEAVDRFRKSAAFEEELADATTGSYMLGFRDCREKIGRTYNLVGLEDIEPEDCAEEACSPTGQAGNAPTPVDEVRPDDESRPDGSEA